MLENANEYEGDIRCPKGVRDCDPPSIYQFFFSTFGMLLLLYLTDLVFYMLFDDTFSDDGMRETPLFLNLLIGYLLASILFVILYVYFGRPPRNDETEKFYRSRTKKGLIFGFSMGSLVFVPFVFFMSSIQLEYNIGTSLLEAIFHILQMIVAGVLVANLLGTPAKET